VQRTTETNKKILTQQTERTLGTSHNETNVARIKMLQYLKINSCNITVSQPQHHEIANVTHHITIEKSKNCNITNEL